MINCTAVNPWPGQLLQLPQMNGKAADFLFEIDKAQAALGVIEGGGVVQRHTLAFQIGNSPGDIPGPVSYTHLTISIWKSQRYPELP